MYIQRSFGDYPPFVLIKVYANRLRIIFVSVNPFSRVVEFLSINIIILIIPWVIQLIIVRIEVIRFNNMVFSEHDL